MNNSNNKQESFLRERNVQREKLLQEFSDEYVKNDKGTLVFCKSPGDPIKFYFENYDKRHDVNYKKRNEKTDTEVSLRDLMMYLRYCCNCDEVNHVFKNDGKGMDYIKELKAFYEVNDVFKNDAKLMDFINELKAFVSHFDGLKDTLNSFEGCVKLLIESLENNYNNIKDDELQKAAKETETVKELTLRLHTDCDAHYEQRKNLWTVYERRMRLIELAVVYVHDFMDTAMKRYIDAYWEIRYEFGFVAGDDKVDDNCEEDDYRDDERIEEFITHLKCVHGAVTDTLREAVTVERKLKEHTEKLERNHEETNI